MSLKLPVCPHCGQKVGFVKAWFLKQEGEYRCSSCGGFSNVHLDSSAPVTGSVAVLLSVVIFLLFRFITGQMPFLGILAMAVPYLLFFLLAPFLVRLKKPGVRKKPQPPPQQQRSAAPPHPRQSPPRPPQGSGGVHHIRRQ